MIAKWFFLNYDKSNQIKLRFVNYSVLFVILLFSVFSVKAGATYVRSYVIGGTVRENGVPVAGKAVLIKDVYDANNAHNFYSISFRILISDSNGYFSYAAPCYVPNPWTGIGLLNSHQGKVLGTSSSWSGPSSGGCNWGDNHFINSISVSTNSSAEGDNQNAGPGCSKVPAAGEPAIGEPVNVTNGNMWL